MNHVTYINEVLAGLEEHMEPELEHEHGELTGTSEQLRATEDFTEEEANNNDWEVGYNYN